MQIRHDHGCKEALQQYYGEKIKYYDSAQEWLISVLHRMRTYLNGSIGFQHLILDGLADEPEEEREFLEEAHRSSEAVLKLINDLQDIVRIEGDKMHLDIGEVKLDEVFEDVEKFRILAQKKQLNLSLQIPNNSERIILFPNLVRLREVMSELVDNAIKFTIYGEIKISAEVIEKKVVVNNRELVNMLKIAITDTGIGVSPDKQNYFFKLPRDRNGCGTGFLLSKSLVKVMGGEMIFSSQGEGLGSTVTLTLPMLGSLE